MFLLEHAALQPALAGGEHLAHGYAANIDIAAPFVAAIQQCGTLAIERAAIGILAFHGDFELVGTGTGDFHGPGHFALARHMAGEAPLADQRLGLGHGFLPVAPGLAVERITLGQLGHHFLLRQFEPVAVAGKGLVFEGRPAAEVEVHELLPLRRRAALQGDARAGVTAGAHLLEVGIELLDGVQAALQGVTHALGLARRQALPVGEELDHIAALLVADLQAIHDLHARNAHQPAFRRLALVADAAQGIVAFRRMARHAFGVEDGLAIRRKRRLPCCASHHGQGPGTQVMPKSSHLQGQASTLLFFLSAPVDRQGAHPLKV
ncbi:hypothetical protein D3C76_555030 [compost metagenome]